MDGYFVFALIFFVSFLLSGVIIAAILRIGFQWLTVPGLKGRKGSNLMGWPTLIMGVISFSPAAVLMVRAILVPIPHQVSYYKSDGAWFFFHIIHFSGWICLLGMPLLRPLEEFGEMVERNWQRLGAFWARVTKRTR